jgi:hypothetical protein
MNDLPFTCVESEEFRNLIYNLRKDAFIPSADTVKTEIINFFNSNQKKIRTILQVYILYIIVYIFFIV